MHWKNAAVALVLTCSAFTLIGVGIFAIGLVGKDGGKGESPVAEDRRSPGDDRKLPGEGRKAPEGGGSKEEKDKDESLKTPKKKNSNGPPAKCGELRPVPGLRLQQGGWVLQEKLEFPDGMTHHTVVPTRDQTSICLRTEMIDVTDKGSTLLTDFYMKFILTKNFTGYIKVKENMHWNFHMLAKDHDGMVVEADPSRYFVFIECVAAKSSKEGEDLSVPGSVFVYTRGNLPDADMDKIRANVESILRHDDETFLDFGGYCYDKKTPPSNSR